MDAGRPCASCEHMVMQHTMLVGQVSRRRPARYGLIFSLAPGCRDEVWSARTHTHSNRLGPMKCPFDRQGQAGSSIYHCCVASIVTQLAPSRVARARRRRLRAFERVNFSPITALGVTGPQRENAAAGSTGPVLRARAPARRLPTQVRLRAVQVNLERPARRPAPVT